MKPRPTPPTPAAKSYPDEFGRPVDLQTQATGPREFARATAGSYGQGGLSSRIITPDEG